MNPLFSSQPSSQPSSSLPSRGRKQPHPELTISQFKVTRQVPTSTKRKPVTEKKEDQPVLNPLLIHQKKLSEFARDFEELLPQKRKELESDELNGKQRLLLEAQVRCLEDRYDEKKYLERALPLLQRYEHCVKEAHLNAAGAMQSSVESVAHFGRVENKELNAAKNAFYMETLGYIPAQQTRRQQREEDLSCDECASPLIVSDGYDVCIECGSVPVNSCSDYQNSYRDTQDVMVKQAGSYKRSARFSDWLSSIQAKESTEIPENVFNAINKEIARERITDLSLIDTAKIREYLGKMRLTRYYDHAPRIVKYINGIPPIVISAQTESQLNIMFNHVQPAFDEIRHLYGRSSFLSYPFALFKFAQLLGRDDIPKPQLLKCPEKLRVQETIWKHLCELVGWTFIATI